MENDYGFCIHCGATCEKGAEFCPECGRSPTGADIRDERMTRVRNPMSFFILLMGLFAAVSIIEGFFETFFNDLYLTGIEMVNGSDMDAYLSDMGLDSREQLAEIIYKEGLVSMACGIMVAISLSLCVQRRFWLLAVLLCVGATLLLPVPMLFMTPEMVKADVITAVLQMAIGLMVVRGICISRRLFR